MSTYKFLRNYARCVWAEHSGVLVLMCVWLVMQVAVWIKYQG